MIFQSLGKVQASFKLHILLGMLRIQGSLTGLDHKSLQKLKAYLRVSLGLVQPNYSQALQRPQLLYPGLTARPWHDPADFEWTTLLENRFETIKDEFYQIYSQDRFRKQQQGVEDVGQWQVYYLYHLGRKAEDNCRRCPQTAELIESISGVSNSGSVYFSVLSKLTHLSPHYGPYNTKLRCHLSLVVPEKCRIRVGEETRMWNEGKCLVFDDSFEHEVWNLSHNPRAVLLIDFWHPDLTAAEIKALEHIMQLSPKARKHANMVLENYSR